MNLADFDAQLAHADVADDALFHEIVQRALRLLAVDRRLIAHQFDVSLVTADRWIAGENAPTPTMRKPVYDWFRQEIEEARNANNTAFDCPYCAGLVRPTTDTAFHWEGREVPPGLSLFQCGGCGETYLRAGDIPRLQEAVGAIGAEAVVLAPVF